MTIANSIVAPQAMFDPCLGSAIRASSASNLIRTDGRAEARIEADEAAARDEDRQVVEHSLRQHALGAEQVQHALLAIGRPRNCFAVVANLFPFPPSIRGMTTATEPSLTKD